jgi:hypothetical protein
LVFNPPFLNTKSKNYHAIFPLPHKKKTLNKTKTKYHAEYKTKLKLQKKNNTLIMISRGIIVSGSNNYNFFVVFKIYLHVNENIQIIIVTRESDALKKKKKKNFTLE